MALVVTLPASVSRVDGPGGLSKLTIASRRASGEMFEQGAHLTAWRPEGAEPVLWVSRQSQYQPGRPIRGGVPICFPWFAAHPGDAAAPMHGFARIRPWSLIAADDRDGTVHLAFSLADDEVSRRTPWPHAFRAEFRVAFGDRLAMALDIANTGRSPVSFEAALHTYLAVRDIRAVEVTGLAGSEYLDKTDGLARKRQGSAPLRFDAETDRVYLDTEAACVVHDAGMRRRIEVAKTGSRSTVVWNPWIAKAAAMPDFGDDEWTGMVCIETANVGQSAVRLEPDSHHTMTAVIAVAAL